LQSSLSIQRIHAKGNRVVGEVGKRSRRFQPPPASPLFPGRVFSWKPMTLCWSLAAAKTCPLCPRLHAPLLLSENLRPAGRRALTHSLFHIAGVREPRDSGGAPILLLGLFLPDQAFLGPFTLALCRCPFLYFASQMRRSV